jgi:hypothetical protein
MFAVSRTDRVIGRTRILTVSIIAKNGFKGAGAPIGSNPATTDLGLKKIADKIKDIHRGRPNERETAKWLVLLNT